MFAQISFAPRICHNMFNLHFLRFISLTSILFILTTCYIKLGYFMSDNWYSPDWEIDTPIFPIMNLIFCLNLSRARLSDNDYTSSKMNTQIRFDIFINNKSLPFSILLVCYHSISWTFRLCPISVHFCCTDGCLSLNLMARLVD